MNDEGMFKRIALAHGVGLVCDVMPGSIVCDAGEDSFVFPIPAEDGAVGDSEAVALEMLEKKISVRVAAAIAREVIIYGRPKTRIFRFYVWQHPDTDQVGTFGKPTPGLPVSVSRREDYFAGAYWALVVTDRRRAKMLIPEQTLEIEKVLGKDHVDSL